jgi:RND family efflux transporter MFP subunit
MPMEPVTTPSPRQLRLTGIIALALAGAIATGGLVSRAHETKELVRWTNAQAVPNVALAGLTRGPEEQSLILPGTIQPYNKAAIYARVSGYLRSWQQDIGANVSAGQVLATIDTPDLDQQLQQARANLGTATANANLAAVTAARWTTLVKSQWVSQQDADNKTGAANATGAAMTAADANVKQLEAMESFKTIVAPFDGVITQRNTDIGALINAGSASGQELFEVSDLRRVRIYVQVPQTWSAALHPGLPATFELPQYPGQQFQAALVTMSKSMQANSHSMLVELQADNADGKLYAGSYCEVHFQLPGNPNMVLVPATALVPVNQGAQVAILGDHNKVTLRSIQLGRDFGDSVEVTAGLTPQDRVIDSPPETLRSGDIVRLASSLRQASDQTARTQ